VLLEKADIMVLGIFTAALLGEHHKFKGSGRISIREHWQERLYQSHLPENLLS